MIDFGSVFADVLMNPIVSLGMMVVLLLITSSHITSFKETIAYSVILAPVFFVLIICFVGGLMR